MNHKNNNSSLIKTGLILIPVMLLFLIVTSLNRNTDNVRLFDGGGAFFLSYVLCVIYFFIVIFSNKPFYKVNQIDKRVFIILLIQLSISSFTLNNSIVIFAQFTLWVKIYLIFFYCAFLSICFIEKIPKLLRYFIFFFLGAGLVITIYFAACLTPASPYAVIGLILLGITIHLLAPLLLSINIVFNYIKLEKSTIEKRLFYTGILLPLIITSFFLFKWDNFKTEIHKATSSIVTRPNNTLPNWVLLCQNIPNDPFSKKIVKANLVYESFNQMQRNWGGTMFNEVRKHDPLVNIGMSLLGDTNLDRDTRVKILKSQFNARHLSQRKLWSGRNLATIDVLNNIKIFPDYRLSYTEKILTIKNFNSWNRNQQEAAYTFYLPEGSVATSLSLWINGKEEKSRLTTKEKADSAYVSIVGVERRDPALLHWQEGNTLTVTVFPCTPEENRKFKIGITTPLKKVNNTLHLQNVYFDGPFSKNTIETSKVTFESDETIENIKLPSGFKKGLDNDFTYTGQFRPYWEASCNTTTLSKKPFVFRNNSYQINELVKQTYTFSAENIYLDINKSWNKSEYDHILSSCGKKQIFAYHDKFIRITPDNKDDIFETLSAKNFSLLPFHTISNWKTALVISKSTELSPNLSDLEDSVFLKNLTNSVNKTTDKIAIFQLGDVLSPYLKSLKELQIVNLHSGKVDDLQKLIESNTFYRYDNASNRVNLDISNVSIIKDSTQVTSEAPDHLLRLFAYNKIMKEFGRNYFKKDPDYVDSLVAIANEAYVVSPISSLVVLETKKDYDRFDISENENSLKNASMKSSGAVPEPEEWVLIILFIGILTVVYFKRKALKI